MGFFERLGDGFAIFVTFCGKSYRMPLKLTLCFEG